VIPEEFFWVLLPLEDDDITLLRNTGNHSHKDTASNPRRPKSSKTPM